VGTTIMENAFDQTPGGSDEQKRQRAIMFLKAMLSTRLAEQRALAARHPYSGIKEDLDVLEYADSVGLLSELEKHEDTKL
jgi:hypothetical protein